MNVRLLALCLAIAGMSPVVVSAQSYVDHGHSPSVVRPVGHGILWSDYNNGCGCATPVGCGHHVTCGAPACGCCQPCRPGLLCVVPNAIHNLGRSLDCLFPCRPKLKGCCSGWGGCSPCHDPACGGGCPKVHFPRLRHHCGKCSTGCCSSGPGCCDSCTAPAALGIPQPLPGPDAPEAQDNPFKDDNSPPEPMPTDARRLRPSRTPYSLGPTPARRPAKSPLAQAEQSAERAVARPLPVRAPKVQRATHTVSPVQNKGAVVRQTSIESESDIITDYTRARTIATQSAEVEIDETEIHELPLNPLR